MASHSVVLTQMPRQRPARDNPEILAATPAHIHLWIFMRPPSRIYSLSRRCEILRKPNDSMLIISILSFYVQMGFSAAPHVASPRNLYTEEVVCRAKHHTRNSAAPHERCSELQVSGRLTHHQRGTASRISRLCRLGHETEKLGLFFRLETEQDVVL